MIQRKKIVPFASGKVLEIGVGSGLNLPFYKLDRVESLIAMDPSVEMLIRAEKSLDPQMPPTQFVRGFAQEIPVQSNSIDTIVMTYTLCSIPDVESSLAEFKRVLKPGGQLLFCEHGLAPDAKVQKWQKRLNPLWAKLGGGCLLDKNIPELIRKHSFTINRMESMYIPGFKPASYNYWGVATPS